MKIFLSGVCVVALSIPLALGLNACKKDKDTNPFNINAKGVYALSAASSVNYLKRIDESSSISASGVDASARPSIIQSDDLNGFRDCLELFDGVINGGNISQSTVKNTSEDAELKQYQFTMTINIPNFEPMEMYYNEIETSTKREIEDENEEVEVSSTLSGVMLFDGSTFNISVKREFEHEGDEAESSTQFITYSSTNKSNYVVISQSVEAEDNEYEIEYKHDLYLNGSKVQSIETEIENENSKIEIEFKLKDLTSGALSTTSFKIQKGTNPNTYVIRYRSNGVSEVINATQTSTGYTLEYSNGFSENLLFTKV